MAAGRKTLWPTVQEHKEVLKLLDARQHQLAGALLAIAGRVGPIDPNIMGDLWNISNAPPVIEEKEEKREHNRTSRKPGVTEYKEKA